MSEFKAFAPGVQVIGQSVLSIVEGMGAFRETALRILKEHNIINPQPNHWYVQQDWLDAFKVISEKAGSMTLLMIGRQIPKNAKWPPDVDTLEKGLSSIDTAYHMNHRGGDIGCYRFEKTGDRSAKMVCRNPYPCDFDLGLIDAVAHKFKPPSVPIITAKHDPSQPCRKKGADSCTYLIHW